MKKGTFEQEDGFGQRLVGRLVILVMVASFLGCVAALPALIYYAETHKGFAVTAQLPVNADKIYQTALEIIEEYPAKYKLVEKDDEKMRLKVDATYDDGIHKTVVKVTRIDDKRSQVLAISDTPGDRKADETAALRSVKILCNKLGVKYKLVKG